MNLREVYYITNFNVDTHNPSFVHSFETQASTMKSTFVGNMGGSLYEESSLDTTAGIIDDLLSSEDVHESRSCDQEDRGDMEVIGLNVMSKSSKDDIVGSS